MKPVFGKARRFGDQMLAAAEADFEPDLASRRVEQFGEVVAGAAR